mmetsp:Transcript_11521/g.31906  ORF Transcript_11521/g.31906 Transcript_11521/m.31906 type:complete len:144 (+) Transcript_11521:21-452(+)
MGCGHSKFPPEGEAAMAADTHVFSESDIDVRLVFRNLRTPSRRSNYRATWSKGSLAISDQRILGYVQQRGKPKRQVNVPFENSRPAGIQFSVTDQGHFQVSSDLAIVHPSGEYSGTMELVYKTVNASEFLRRIPRAKGDVSQQ